MNYAARRSPDCFTGQRLGANMTTSNNFPCSRPMAIQDILNPSTDDARPSTSPSLGSESSLDSNDHNSRLHAGPRGMMRAPRSRGNFRRRRSSPSAQSDSSRSQGSPDVPARSRPFRPAYNTEMADFMWFLRIDLQRPWDEICADYMRQFPEDDRDKSGLQCKFYRHIAHYGITPTRAQRASGPSSQYGMWTNTGKRYPWMASYASVHQVVLPGKFL